MSALKNLLKSDSPKTSNDGSRASLSGQGSHFHQDDPPLATRASDAGIGSTVTGSEPHTNATPHSFPRTMRSGSINAKAGSAAVGETTTYSSRPLASGDPTGSVIDHRSTDPLTYKMPEAGSHAPATRNAPTSPTISSAVTSPGAAAAAAAAASRAWSTTHNKEDNIPGGFPSAGHENPYKATNLDPRVDGGRAASSTVQPSFSLPTRTRDTPIEPSTYGTDTGASTSLGGLGSSQGGRSVQSSHDRTGPAPSTLTTTADPSARSAEYGTSSSAKVPDTTTLRTSQSQSSGEQQGVVGRTLGALGLGGAANYLGYGSQGADATSEPRDTSAIATQPGAVAQESGPPTHYRRESIPTTAYPGGPSSPRAVAPPIGGAINPSALAQESRQESGPPKHYRRQSIPTTAYPGGPGSTRAIAPPIGGAVDPRQSSQQGYGSSSTGFSNERGIGGTSATTEGVSSAPSFGLGAATSGMQQQDYTDSARLRDNIGTQQSGYSSSRPSGTDDNHTGRNLATAGAAAAAVGAGAGAHGLQHQGRSDDLRSSAAADAQRLPSGGVGSTLASGQSYNIGGTQAAPVAGISSHNPSDRESASRGLGYGSSTSPNAPMDAAAAAPARYDGQDYNQQGSKRDDHHHHTGSGVAAAALGAGPGLAFASGDGRRHNTIHDAITVTPSAADRASYEGPSGYGTTDSSYGTSAGHGTTGTTGISSHGTSSGYGTTGTTGVHSHGTSTVNDTVGTTGTTGVSSHGITSRHGTTGTTDTSSYGTSTGHGITGRGVPDNTVGDRSYRQEDDHTGRNVGVGAAAGTAALGGAAYAAHDRSSERELEKQREADAKDVAKREKAQEKELEKERKEERKEEKKYQKELEKEEKHHEKDLRKEEKERAHEAEKREKARLGAEEEDRKRREREAAAGIATVGHSGPIAREHDPEQKEKKPSIFKRIFKRRKNKDTGEDEDYSTDDEDDKARYAAAGGSSVPIHHSEDKDRNVLGHSSRDKESYKEHPAWKGPVTDIAAENSMNTPGRAHPGAEDRLGYAQDSTRAGYTPTGREGGVAAISGATAAGTSSEYGNYDRSSATGATAGTRMSSDVDNRPVEPLTGMPYDPSKDPAAAARLAESAHLGSQPLGEIGEHSR